MNKQTLQFLSALFSAAAAAALAHANGAPEDTTSTGTGDGGEAPKRGRGRPPAEKAATETAGTGAAAPTDEERLNANRALIKPLVDANQGAEVQKVVLKYSKTGLKDLPAESQKAFENDIAALTY